MKVLQNVEYFFQAVNLKRKSFSRLIRLKFLMKIIVPLQKKIWKKM